jgi:hypothetical protein
MRMALSVHGLGCLGGLNTIRVARGSHTRTTRIGSRVGKASGSTSHIPVPDTARIVDESIPAPHGATAGGTATLGRLAALARLPTTATNLRECRIRNGCTRLRVSCICRPIRLPLKSPGCNCRSGSVAAATLLGSLLRPTAARCACNDHLLFRGKKYAHRARLVIVGLPPPDRGEWRDLVIREKSP